MNGAMLRVYRDYLGLTQNELAEVFGVERVTVARWESPDPKYPIPGGVSVEMEHLLSATDELVEGQVLLLESQTTAPVIFTFRTVDELAAAWPELEPASLGYWNVICARVLEQCEFEVDIEYAPLNHN